MTANDPTTRRQREVLGLLATATAAPAPSGLRAEVMEAAGRGRTPGAAFDAPEPLSAPAAFARAIANLDDVLGSLAADDWDRTVEVYRWSVHGLVAHLAAIDHYLAAQLGLIAPIHDAALADDHIEMTRASVDAAAAMAPSETLARWRTGAHRLVEFAAGLDDDALRTRVRFHYLETRLATILITRVFEIWTHTEDILRATGQVVEPPAAEMLIPMTRVAVPAIPLGMVLRGDDGAGRTARIVLIGPGGGVFVQPLGIGERPDSSTTASVTVIADALSFCRLAAQRLTSEDLGADIEGDVDLGHRVLAAAAVFAA